MEQRHFGKHVDQEYVLFGAASLFGIRGNDEPTRGEDGRR
jgi:hypothetical protein